MMIEETFKVCTHCFTYNHAPYIKEAMDGFIMQETSFPFVICIIDDASTDGEPFIIESYFRKEFDYNNTSIAYEIENDYSKILFAQHKTNLNCYFAVLLLKENLYSKGKTDLKYSYISKWSDNADYIAICEGDDHWANPKKLAMQVSFMDENLDYSMCHTNGTIGRGKKRYGTVYICPNDECFPHSVFHEMTVLTATVLYRNETYNRLPKLWIGKDWKMGDTPLWIELSKYGKIKYFSESTANYNVLPVSASHGGLEKEINFYENAIEIHRFYANYYNIDLPNQGYDKGYFLAIAKSAFKYNDKKVAWSNIYKALNSKEISLKTIVIFLCTIIPFLGAIVKRLTKDPQY